MVTYMGAYRASSTYTLRHWCESKVSCIPKLEILRSSSCNYGQILVQIGLTQSFGDRSLRSGRQILACHYQKKSRRSEVDIFVARLRTSAAMGTGKKESTRRKKQGKEGDGMQNIKTKGENFYRSAKQAKTLQIFKEGKAQRNADGKIVKAASFQSREKPKARVEPNRRWFGNTRVISQDALNSFREAIAERAADPYQVLLKSNKLPMGLVRDGDGKNGPKQHQAKMQVESAPFNETFGPKSLRKRVKLSVGTMEDFAQESSKQHESYSERHQQSLPLNDSGMPEEPEGEAKAEEPVLTTALEPIFLKGQSKRIWNELYKVIDSSDVVLHVLDARDPLGTRCRSVEKYIKEEAPHKHLVFVLNKCDLVPTSVAVSTNSTPTLSCKTSFQSSVKTSFSILVQYSVKVCSVTTLVHQSVSTACRSISVMEYRGATECRV